MSSIQKIQSFRSVWLMRNIHAFFVQWYTKVAYCYSLLDETKLEYEQKRYKFLIMNLNDNINFVWQFKLNKNWRKCSGQFWEHAGYTPGFLLCNYCMFKPTEKRFGRHQLMDVVVHLQTFVFNYLENKHPLF